MIDASKNRKKRTGAAMGSSLLCFPGTGVTSVDMSKWMLGIDGVEQTFNAVADRHSIVTRAK